MKTKLSAFLMLAGLSATVVSCSDATSNNATNTEAAATTDIKESLGTQWTPVALNTEGETVSAFAVAQKGRLVAGTSAGILLSDDGGATWKPAAVNADDKAAVFSLTTDASGALYAGMSRNGVLVSTDNGDSWKLYNAGLNPGGPRSTYALVAAGDNILKGTFESGLYLSADKGQSWQPANNGIPLDLNTSKMVSVTQLVKNKTTVYALTDLGVRYSTDGGASFNKPKHNGVERLGYMTSLAVHEDRLYCGMTSSVKGVYVSTDNGENWTLAGLGDKAVGALYTAPNGTVYAGTEGEIFRSADGGKTWTAVGAGLPAKAPVYAIGLTPGGQLLAGMNRNGIYLLK